MVLTSEELKRISDAVGERSGWDFSRVCAERAPVPWTYPEVAREFLSQTDRVLDIGTGGGELLLTLAPYFGEGIGIDSYPEMIDQAQHNRTARRIQNVDLVRMDGRSLGLADAQFDVVLSRHCHVDASETQRVLRPRGTLITQQVACRNTLSVLQAFGWTPASFGDGWWQPVEKLAAQFERLGCRIVAKAEYNVRYWFRDIESLVFWLKAAPLPEPFDVERHWQGVNRLLEEHSTERGIETNEHRELLIVRKV